MTFKWTVAFLALVLVGCASAAAVPSAGGGGGGVAAKSGVLVCPEGFTKFEVDLCLNISRDVLNGSSPHTWQQARTACMALSVPGWGVDLAYTINDKVLMQVNDYLANHEPDMKGWIYWVGGLRTSSAAHWEWTDGQLVDKLSYVFLPGVFDSSPENKYTILVPAGAHNRHYLTTYSEQRISPSWICQAAPQCA